MKQEIWSAVDDYFLEQLFPADPVLDEVLKANAAAGLRPVDVTPTQGKLLYLLARIRGAQRVLEIGTLGGYSTIWLARAVAPSGRVVTLEREPKHAAVASANIERAGLNSIVEIRIGVAAESLVRLHEEGGAPFDLIFIDADKRDNPIYLEWSLRLSRVGSVIVGDNVVRRGAVADPADPDPDIQGLRRFFEMIAAEPRLEATAIQTVGSKDYDGFALALVVK
jgi:predicted O-methyltransferase YrrM